MPPFAGTRAKNARASERAAPENAAALRRRVSALFGFADHRPMLRLLVALSQVGTSVLNWASHERVDAVSYKNFDDRGPASRVLRSQDGQEPEASRHSLAGWVGPAVSLSCPNGPTFAPTGWSGCCVQNHYDYII